MDIPIQVAVRIFPCQHGPAPPAASVSATVEQQLRDGTFNDNVNDCNGNVNADTAGDALQTGARESQPTLESNVCVQAMQMAPAGFLCGAPTALPGQLDSAIAAGVLQVGSHSFPVTHALPVDCTLSQIYHQTVFPLISLFTEGFDASVVTYGQRGVGKTYTLYGPGFDCVYGEAEQGVVQRCVREIFEHMANHPERTYAVNIGWVEIAGEVIHDLLGVGNVHCESVSDVFHWLQLGLNARTARNTANIAALTAHSLFTLTLEQQWVTKEGLIQHRLSTASFSDLCGTERVLVLNALDQPTSMPKDGGLQALEQVVNTLTDPALMYGVNGNIPYNQTTLTTLLKDSFGGRAQTLLMLCVSPLERDCNETLCNLQFAFKVQCVRNYVIMNTFSDDNTPISPESVVSELVGGGIGVGGVPPGVDNFGLQFAASQWFKLVSNAEGLFSKLVSSNAISDLDKEQIEEWLFLKQECEECLSSSEALRSQKQLGPIQEAEEPEETVSEPETSCQQNSDNESDSESQRPDLEEKLETLMDELCSKTDTLVTHKYKEFMQSHPKAVMESQESGVQSNEQKVELVAVPAVEQRTPPSEKFDERKTSIGGRRRSIQPGASLSSAEIAMLNRVASREHAAPKSPDDFLDSSGDLPLRAAIKSPLDNIQKKLRKLDTEIEARQRQIKELEQTMHLKQNIITELVKNSDTRTTAKQRFNKKKAKLEAEYEKTKKQLAKAVVQGKEKGEIERLRTLIAHIEQRLQDLASIKHIAGESGQKVKKLQQSLHESKKLVDDLQKKVKKERKLREQLDAEMKDLKEKENNSNNNKALVKIVDNVGGIGAGMGGCEEERGKNLREVVQARISHLDHVLREKSENLEQYREGADGAEGLRHEIRNLRRTRDHLLEQRCSLDRKLKRDKILSHREERKLLECDEAIEAIDAAIEFKNELICGHRSIDTSERLQREKGEQMLMARLNKLSVEEMRTLLYKYFTKVIDLRDASRKLEVQLMQLERERDAWEWKERVLSNAVRQARLEGERNAVLLQRQHEMKLTLMLRHLAEETSASSTSFGEQAQPTQQRCLRPGNLQLAPHQLLAGSSATTTGTGTATSQASSQFSDSDFDLEFYKNSLPAAAVKMLKPPKHGEMEICPLPDALAKYKPLDKFKEKERETKNKLFAKFQVLTRYAGQSVTTDEGHGVGGGTSGNAKKKEKEVGVAIPQENLKRLISAPPATKVTRQKNKIIIQDATRKN